MKILFCLLTLFLPISAELVEFTAAGAVHCDGVRIDVGSYAAPLAVDWNSDGLKDLITGQFDGGMIRYYPNIGTNDSPVFEEFFYLMNGPEPLSVPWG